ncbi:hypothetical protein CBS101457_003102 [Exobasidium rhododendri]|nr:hypothetical protein CBS101457_003102 [Exobasidium rhododendri]
MTLEEAEWHVRDEHRRNMERFHNRYWGAREDAHTALNAAYRRNQLNVAILENRRQQEENAAAEAAAAAARASRPPKQHRVYLINCKSCDAFLTDRGMKAVLLLRPHITLFSTDAMPVCGPLFPTSTQAMEDEPHVERTCNCLTQTLGCYGCGSAVGYHIVSPCQKCTSSVAKHQRNSNGHRTVLHCAEIRVRERRYIPGESGVMTAKIDYPDPYKSRRHQNRPPLHPPSEIRPRRDVMRRNTLGGIDTMMDDLEEEDNKEVYYQTYSNTAPTTAPPSVALPQVEESKGPRALKRGDIIYWSDLVTGGERSEPIDSDKLLEIPVCLR